MWQRIQTLYLILACAIVAALFFCPLAVAVGSEGVKEPIFFVDNVFFLCLMIAIAIFNFLALVFFKHRIFQMRVGTVAALMLLGFQVWILVKYFTVQSGRRRERIRRRIVEADLKRIRRRKNFQENLKGLLIKEI